MTLRGSGFKALGLWWLVGAVVGVGVLVIAAGHVRGGGQVMAGGFLLGAALRLVRSDPGAGGLRVRSRTLDVVVLLALAVAILYAAGGVNLTP